MQADVSAAAGGIIDITDSTGAKVATLTAATSVSNVVFSSPSISQGQTYTVGGEEVTAGVATTGAGHQGRGAGGPAQMGRPEGSDMPPAATVERRESESAGQTNA